MKTCRDCGGVKPIEEFYKHKMMSDGHLNRCKDCVRDRVNRHRSANVDRIREYDRNRGYRGDPEKQKERQKVRTALKSGRMTRQACHCGSTTVEAHHTDYSKPLDVVWLCRAHHAELHRDI